MQQSWANRRAADTASGCALAPVRRVDRRGIAMHRRQRTMSAAPGGERQWVFRPPRADDAGPRLEQGVDPGADANAAPTAKPVPPLTTTQADPVASRPPAAVFGAFRWLDRLHALAGFPSFA